MCAAYCVMTSHYHLILQVDEGVLPAAMHLVNRRYARHFNRAYGLRGHALGDRYGSRRIEDELDLLDTFTYVVRNPVTAGLCAIPADYPWSSYAATVGLAEPASFVDASSVLTAVGHLAGDPVVALRRRVEGPVPGTGL
jgi:putative transposase